MVIVVAVNYPFRLGISRNPGIRIDIFSGIFHTQGKAEQIGRIFVGG